MKKILVFAAILLLTSAIVNAQQPWVTHKVDNKVSIQFPTTPKEFIPGSFM